MSINIFLKPIGQAGTSIRLLVLTAKQLNDTECFSQKDKTSQNQGSSRDNQLLRGVKRLALGFTYVTLNLHKKDVWLLIELDLSSLSLYLLFPAKSYLPQLHVNKILYFLGKKKKNILFLYTKYEKRSFNFISNQHFFGSCQIYLLKRINFLTMILSF